MVSAKTCLKCDGRLEEGFTVDFGHNANHVTGWQKGKPEKRWWGLKIKRKELTPIECWRCTRCGFLEHYAR